MNYEFYHHGIAGQKWGERHGPPYPLDRTKKNAKKLTKDINQLNKDYAKQHLEQLKWEKKAQRAANKGQDISQYVAEGKKYLNNKNQIDKMQNMYIKKAKDAGFEVVVGKKYYDERSFMEKGGPFGAIGGGISAAVAIKNGKAVLRNYYKVKMPKITIT